MKPVHWFVLFEQFMFWSVFSDRCLFFFRLSLDADGAIKIDVLWHGVIGNLPIFFLPPCKSWYQNQSTISVDLKVEKFKVTIYPLFAKCNVYNIEIESLFEVAVWTVTEWFLVLTSDNPHSSQILMWRSHKHILKLLFFSFWFWSWATSSLTCGFWGNSPSNSSPRTGIKTGTKTGTKM